MCLWNWWLDYFCCDCGLLCVGLHTLGGQWRRTRRPPWRSFLKESFKSQMGWLLLIRSLLNWLWKMPNKLFSAVNFSSFLIDFKDVSFFVDIAKCWFWVAIEKSWMSQICFFFLKFLNAVPVRKLWLRAVRMFFCDHPFVLWRSVYNLLVN